MKKIVITLITLLMFGCSSTGQNELAGRGQRSGNIELGKNGFSQLQQWHNNQAMFARESRFDHDGYSIVVHEYFSHAEFEATKKLTPRVVAFSVLGEIFADQQPLLNKTGHRAMAKLDSYAVQFTPALGSDYSLATVSHSDARVSRGANQSLSNQRAAAVTRHLDGLGWWHASHSDANWLTLGGANRFPLDEHPERLEVIMAGSREDRDNFLVNYPCSDNRCDGAEFATYHYSQGQFASQTNLAKRLSPQGMGLMQADDLLHLEQNPAQQAGGLSAIEAALTGSGLAVERYDAINDRELYAVHNPDNKSANRILIDSATSVVGSFIQLDSQGVFSQDNQQLTDKGEQASDHIAGHIGDINARLNQPGYVLVSAHSFSSKDRTRNLKASEQQARLVAEQLVKQGIDESKIVILGGGQEFPDKVSGKISGSNDRVELFVTEDAAVAANYYRDYPCGQKECTEREFAIASYSRFSDTSETTKLIEPFALLERLSLEAQFKNRRASNGKPFTRRTLRMTNTYRRLDITKF